MGLQLRINDTEIALDNASARRHNCVRNDRDLGCVNQQRTKPACLFADTRLIIGADPNDLVPFEKYAAAADGLTRPSSAARALFAGAPNIERTDRLVQAIGAQKGMRSPIVDETVATVDARLAINRKAAA